MTAFLSSLRAGLTGGWAAIISTIARIALAIAQAVRDKQLLDAGEARGVARLSAEEQERVNAANRAAVRARDADRLPDDAYRD